MIRKLPDFYQLQIFSIFFAALIFTGCKHASNTDGSQFINSREVTESDDFDGAAAYEFNMLKDPATGTIPEGVYEQEKQQANQIANSQTRRATANSFTFQGPDNLGGRTRSIAYDVRYNGTSNQVVLAGGVSGGVYKSTDGGATWSRKSPLGEHFSCTSLAQDPRAGSQNTWYYTVGEASGNSTGATGAFYSGNGVYKSTDNGDTWTRLTNSNTTAIESFSTAADYINKVAVDPTNGNVYIACAATIRRSTDGGGTWATVINGTLANSAQFTDVIITSTGLVYAAFGGTNSVGFDGVWKSTSGDFGSYTRIAGGGTPATWSAQNTYGRVVLAAAPSNENLVYALYWNGTTSNCAGTAAPEASFFRWDNSGSTWTDLSATLPDEAGCSNGNDPFAVQTGYDLVVAVKPNDANAVFIGGTNSYRSADAGLTWTRIGGYNSAASYALYPNSHSDVHAFAFNPVNNSTMLCGNDGGLQQTDDVMASPVVWNNINSGYRTYQYYYVDIDPRVGNNKVIGGAQDNGSTRNVGETGSIFESVLGGDGVSVGLSDDILGVTYEYVGSQSGNIYRRSSALPANFGTSIRPSTAVSAGLFVTLFKLDNDNTETLYYANANKLFVTPSASTVTTLTWTELTGISTAATGSSITAITPSRGTYNAASSSLFFGTSTGKIFRLDNPTGVAASTAPVNITGAGFSGNVSSIAVNPRNDDTVMVTMSNYGVTSVYWTGNANTATPTWTAVEGALTLPSYRSSSIIVTPSGVQYFVGTSVGLYSSFNLPGSVSWAQEGAGDMGNAVIASLALRTSDNNLLVGTHGYGMWKTSFPTALPITLNEFKGAPQNSNVLLQWNTSAETNSKNFELERSIDGFTFNKIAIVPAAGNSNSLRKYTYLDKQIKTEKVYYRLRLVDIDGRNNLSNIVMIKMPEIQQGINVLGNPFRDHLSIQLVKPAEQKGELSLFDLQGKLMAKKTFNAGEQLLQFNISSGNINSGIYILKCVINGKVYTSKVVKQ